MKKLLMFVLACSIIICFTTTAYSEGMYVGGSLGTANLSDTNVSSGSELMTLESDMGWVGALAWGYKFRNKFRAEGELAYQKNDASTITYTHLNVDGDVTRMSIMANGYYDFENTSRFTPFVMAGIGGAKVEANDLNVPGEHGKVDDNDQGFAYQLGLGVAYGVNDAMDVDLGYRYFDASDLSFSGADADYQSHNVYVGLRYSF
jgi:opacity protein-like surface antigen